MATYDYNRASFVTEPFRYEKAEDLTVKTAYANAQEITIDTALSTATVATLVTTMFAELKKPALTFQVEIDGIYQLEDFAGVVPSFTLSAPRYSTDTRTFKGIDFDIDYLNNKTTIVMRG